MTYLLAAGFAYLALSPTLAALDIANIYYRDWRAKRRRVREVLELELLWRSNEEPRV